MTDFNISPDEPQTSDLGIMPELFGNPDDVLANSQLTTDEKRALLASWASDANAVAHIPSLRQLPDGSIVNVGEILRALKALDAQSIPPCNSRLRWQRPFERRRGAVLRLWPRNARRSDDDDDPPPCPAVAAVRPRGGGGAAFACKEPVVA